MGERHRKAPDTLLDAYNAGLGDGMVAAVAIMKGWTGKALDGVIKHDIDATRRALANSEDG